MDRHPARVVVPRRMDAFRKKELRQPAPLKIRHQTEIEDFRLVGLARQVELAKSRRATVDIEHLDLRMRGADDPGKLVVSRLPPQHPVMRPADFAVEVAVERDRHLAGAHQRHALAERHRDPRRRSLGHFQMRDACFQTPGHGPVSTGVSGCPPHSVHEPS